MVPTPISLVGQLPLLFTLVQVRQTGSANFLFCIATMNHPVGLDPDLVEGGPAVDHWI